MIKIQYTSRFLKQYNNLSVSVRNKTKQAIKKFEINPKDRSLRAHKLTGTLADFYSFSVDFKYRIVFEMDKKNGVVIFLKIGGHEIYD